MREARPWASTLVGVEAAFYAVVVKPRPLATRHDRVGVGAHQVNHVCGGFRVEHAAQRIELMRRDRDGIFVTVEVFPVVAAEHERACVVITHPHVLGAPPACGGVSVRQKTRSEAGTQNIVCYLGRMDRFLVPAAASIVVGLLLGAAAIFGVTLMVQQDNKPPLQAGDPASSVLNRVEYGDRT